MGFKILTGTDFDEDFLPRVMDLDRDVHEAIYYLKDIATCREEEDDTLRYF